MFKSESLKLSAELLKKHFTESYGSIDTSLTANGRQLLDKHGAG
jgi:hypothetical protein